MDERSDFFEMLLNRFGDDPSIGTIQAHRQIVTLAEEQFSLLKAQLLNFQSMNDVMDWLTAQAEQGFCVDRLPLEECSPPIDLHWIELKSGEILETSFGTTIRWDGMVTDANGLTHQACFQGSEFVGMQYFRSDGVPLAPGETILLADGTEVYQELLPENNQ
jgi:hypothetical protein